MVSVSMDKSQQNTAESAREEELQKILRQYFVKNNQFKYDELIKAVDEGNIKLAEEIAHSLKSNAGQIGEQRLQEAAESAEALFSRVRRMKKTGDTGEVYILDSLRKTLKNELELVLEKLKLMSETNISNPIYLIPNSNEVQEIFEKLQHLLMHFNPECINMLGIISSIPGTEELVQQIEDFEFEQAAFTLEKLRKEGKFCNG
ncbi:MAG: Hpt domain-containing protein [Treponema sp.]|nr:Hpt domain-containing protein [Treponema sp.]